MFANFDNTGEISINRKGYGRYDARKKVDGVLFGGKKQDKQPSSQKEKYEELTGLNELDTNIPTGNNVPLTPLSLELRIENTEKKLKKVNEEKKSNEILNINDTNASQKLQKEEDRLRRDIKSYRSKYRQLGTAYKVADVLTRTKNVAFTGLAEIGARIVEMPTLKQMLLKIPSFKAKQDVEIAKILNNRLKKEFSRPAKPESQTIEHLLVRAEKVTNMHTGTGNGK